MNLGHNHIREPIGKHHAHLTLYVHLLPVLKSGPNQHVTPATVAQIRSTPGFNEHVL